MTARQPRSPRSAPAPRSPTPPWPPPPATRTPSTPSTPPATTPLKSASATASTGSDTTPPTAPTNLTARATSGTTIALTWTPATDNVGVTGYGIYRDGSATALATTTAAAYTDTAVAAGSTHTYTVDAVDAAGNRSAKSAAASATTPTTGGTTITITPDADSYVDASNPSKNYGTTTSVKVDGSPPVTTYLHFTVTGLAGAVTSATLRMFPTTNQKTGFDAHAVTGGAWTETGITAANAPDYSTATLGSSGRVTASVWANADVTPLITGNGSYAIALTTSDPQALSMSSRQGANPPQLVITTNTAGGGGDTTVPSTPTGLTATAAGPTEIDLSWNASTDNVGVTGYHVYRDGSTTAVTTVPGTSYHDTSVAAGSTHTYTVDAYDAAGNTSAKSASANATTPTSGGGTVTVVLTADSYIDPTNPTKNYGATTTLRVDGSPLVISYLRFAVSGLSGKPSKVVLRVYGNSSQSPGYDVHSVADTTWTESGITAANAPGYAAAVLASSGKVAAGTWTSVDITALVTGNGTYSIALATTGTAALSLASRESTNAPQLVITP